MSIKKRLNRGDSLLSITVVLLAFFISMIIVKTDIKYDYLIGFVLFMFITIYYLLKKAETIVYLSIIMTVIISHLPNDMFFFKSIYAVNVKGLFWGYLAILSFWFILRHFNLFLKQIKNPPFYFFLIFFIYAFCSFFFSQFKNTGISVLLHVYVPVAISFIISIIIIKSKSNHSELFLRKVVGIYLAASSISIIIGFIQLLVNFTAIFQGGFSSKVMITGAFNHRLTFGMFLIPVFYLLIAIYQGLPSQGKSSKNNYLKISIVLVFTLIIFNNSRMVWIGFFSSLLVYLFFDKKYKYFILGSILIILFYFIMPNFQERIGSFSNIQSLKEWWDSPVFSTLKGRIAYWEYSFTQFRTISDLLFGRGIGFVDWFYPEIVYEKYGVIAPHNEYLNFCLDFGIMGCLLFFSLFIYFLIFFYRKIRRHQTPKNIYYINLSSLSIVIALLISCITNNIIRHTQIIFFYYVFLFMAWAVNFRSENLRKRNLGNQQW